MAIYSFAQQTMINVTGGTPPFYNILHVTAPLADLTSLNAIAGVIKTFYQARPDIYPNGSTWTVAYKVVQVDGDPPVQVAVTPVNTSTATGTGTLSPQLALVVSWKTVVANRHGRGRMYLGPLANQAQNTSSGQPASGVASGVQTAANAMIAGISGITGCQLVVYNRTAKTSIPITTATVASLFYTQRRRAS
jgi:hypothetical protein